MTDAPNAPLRIAVLGCGRIARMFHLPILRKLEGCVLTAVAEPDPVNLSEARRIVPEAESFGNAAELLEGVAVDAVVVTLPTHLHAETSVAALERGKHVYVEKPLAPSTTEAEPVLEAWRRVGTVGAVGYAFRFHPLFKALKAAIESKAIGDVVAVRASFGSALRDLPIWKRSRASGGGAMVDLMSHHIDLVRFLFDREVEQAGASIRTVRTMDDTAAVHLTLGGGILVQAFASASAVQEDVVEVYGTEGKLVADRFRARFLVSIEPVRKTGGASRARAAIRQALRLGDILVPPREPSFAAALQAFVAATRGSTFDGASLEDGYRALLVAETAEESARTGRTLPVG